MTHRGTILLIDDEEAQLALSSRILETQGGYKCLTFSDPEKGLKRALENDLDLIVLDVIMPGMSGLSIAMEIRDNEQATPILFYSAEIDEATSIQANQLDHTSVLRKAENSTRDLLDTARQAIGQSRTANAIYQMKTTVSSLKAGQRKLFKVTDGVREVLEKISDGMVTRDTIEEHFVQVAAAVGSDDAPDGEMSEAVRKAKDGLSQAIVRRVDEVAFTDFLHRILVSKIFWLFFVIGVAAFSTYVRFSTSTQLQLDKIKEDYGTFKKESGELRKSLGEVKQLLRSALPSPSPSP